MAADCKLIWKHLEAWTRHWKLLEASGGTLPLLEASGEHLEASGNIWYSTSYDNGWGGN